jgi:hypothetical protein
MDSALPIESCYADVRISHLYLLTKTRAIPTAMVKIAGITAMENE